MVFGLLTSSASSNSTTTSTPLSHSRPVTPPSRPDTPELQLNGRPIAAPTSIASPQIPLRRSRQSSPRVSFTAGTTDGSRMGRKSTTGASRDVRQRKSAAKENNSSSNNGANSDASADTLKPVPYTARNSQGNTGAGARTSVKQVVQPTQAPRQKTKAPRPSPLTQPVSYFRFLVWRTRVYFDATFSLGMLAEWEVWLVATIAILSAFVLLYSLFFQFPRHFQTVMKRATYYVWGVGSSALSQQQNQQHQYLREPLGGIPVVGPDGQSTMAL